MIPLIIILSVSALAAAFLLLPVSLHIKFDGDFTAKIKIAGIKAYEPAWEEEHPSEKAADSDKKARTDNSMRKMFGKLEDRLGFSGAVKEIFSFVKSLLKRLKKQLGHIAVRRLCLNIRVASSDAAQTAVEYGAVCSAVYPALSFLDSVTDIKMKRINILSDFNSEKSDFSFSVIIRIKIIFLIILAFQAFSEYNKFITRNEL